MKQILENYYNNKKIKTIIGKNSDLVGHLTFKDSLKINGFFKGNVNSEGLLFIGETAQVTGDISAEAVVVCGVVNGDITAKAKVEMLPTGRVYGNVKAKKIKISDGVIFNGKCEIIKWVYI